MSCKLFVNTFKNLMPLGRKMATLALSLSLIVGVMPVSHAEANTMTNTQTINELRGVWVSYFELESMLKGKSEAAFRAAYETMLDNVKRDGFNTVFVQVRPFGDALYVSNTAPSSYMLTGKEGDVLKYDPLAIMLASSHDKGIRFEAWLNPYRVRINSVKAPISANSLQYTWLNDKSNRVVTIGSGTYFNPSDPSVNQMFVNEVSYLVNHYTLDGIHLDDYFYPTQAASFDKPQYDAYKNAGGKLKLADFRRSRIDEMVQGVYRACQSAKSPVRFGISPQAIMKNNYEGQYANVEKWMTTSGYIDYICPQIYYGYLNQTAPFQNILAQWDALGKKSVVDIYIGLAGYKVGLPDQWAKSGSKEWQTSAGILKQMVVDSRQITHYKGIVVFRYGSMWAPPRYLEKAVALEKELLTSLWLNN